MKKSVYWRHLPDDRYEVGFGYDQQREAIAVVADIEAARSWVRTHWARNESPRLPPYCLVQQLPQGNFDQDQGAMTRGRDDCTVGPVVSCNPVRRPQRRGNRWALRQSRRFYAWAGGFAVR
jgi:hypothetical protein